MNIAAFFLVLASAFAHAYWNYLTKRATNKDVFIGLSKISEVVMFALPFAGVLLYKGPGTDFWLFVGIASVFSIANYFFLIQSYKRLDLSVAYPISRSSTMFLPLIAYLILRETLGPIGWISVFFVTAGVLILQLESFDKKNMLALAKSLKTPGTIFALFAALTVALYTVWGKLAIKHIDTFIYMYSYTAIVAVFYLALLKKNLSVRQLKKEWKTNKWPIMAVGFLNTFSFVLALVALSMTKATYVGALRQLSLVFGLFLGCRMLGEPLYFPRMLGIGSIVLGGCLTLAAK